MSTSELDRLREAMLGDPRPTPFVGAGFSAAVTADAQCATWLGLLRNGIDRCERAGMPDFTSESAEALRTLLNGTGIDNFITVADDISRRLRNQRGKIFSSWIDATVGKLSPKGNGPQLIQAVRNLGSTIFTTNYDKLIEKPTPEWVSCTWTDANYARAARRVNSVVHLHGVVGDPRSIILGSADYGRLNSDKLNPILSTALFAEHIFVFIGCGSGLGDPHIGPLIEEMDRVTPDDDAEHYILVRNDEVDEYWSRQFPRIVPVGYGDSYEELLPFLEDLAPKEKAAAGRASPATEQQSAGNSGAGFFPRGKAAEQQLEHALSVLGVAGDAMWEVDRQRAVPPGIDRLRPGQQESEHRRLVEGLSRPAEELQRCFAELLEAVTAVEDQVWQLTKPKFARHVSPWITETVSQLEAETGRLLTQVQEARDDLLERSRVYGVYGSIPGALSNAYAAIEQAHGILAPLKSVLVGLAPVTELLGEQPASKAPGRAEDDPPSARQRGAAGPEAWRVRVEGSAAAGPGNMSAGDEGKFVSIPPQNAQRANVIAVRVDGESMTGDGLLHGDFAIVDTSRKEPREGEIAVVRLGPSAYAETTVKHVWREEDGLLLKPSDPELHPSKKVPWTEEPFVEGMVIGVFRQVRYKQPNK